MSQTNRVPRSFRIFAAIGVLLCAASLSTVQSQLAYGPQYCKTLQAGSGSGSLTGTYYISLPTISPIKNSDELYSLLGPYAVSVSKLNSTGCTFYNYEGGTCTSGPEPGSAACQTGANPPCFCVNPGEGFRVRVSTTSVFQYLGANDPAFVHALPAGACGTLISLPFAPAATTAFDVMNEIGFAQTASVAKYVTASDTLQVYTGRKSSAANFPIVPGEGYLIKMTTAVNYLPATFGSGPTASCASQSTDYGISGLQNTTDFPWALQNGVGGAVCDNLAGALTPLGNAVQIAQDFTQSINTTASCVALGVGKVTATHDPGVSNFKVTYDNTLTAPPVLLVGSQGGSATCNVNTSPGCSFNPTASKVVLLGPNPRHLGLKKSGADLIVSWDDYAVPGLSYNVYRSVLQKPPNFGAAIATGVNDSDPATPGVQWLDVGASAASDSFFYKITAINAAGETTLSTD